jgi:hypothetical protein
MLGVARRIAVITLHRAGPLSTDGRETDSQRCRFRSTYPSFIIGHAQSRCRDIITFSILVSLRFLPLPQLVFRVVLRAI